MNQTLKNLLGNKDHLGRRYVFLLLGLMICSFGVAFTTRAGLGTSPVSSIPYSLSLAIPTLSFGSVLVLFCYFQIIVQLVLLRRQCVISELIIQAVLAFVYGYLTDFSMFLLRNVKFDTYIQRLIFFIVGCLILAFGVYMELVGDVAMLSGDAFIKAIAQVCKKPYSNVKVATDFTMSVLAGIICLVSLGKLEGVREGTIIAAFLVGFIIKLYQKIFKKAEKRLLAS